MYSIKDISIEISIDYLELISYLKRNNYEIISNQDKDYVSEDDYKLILKNKEYIKQYYIDGLSKIDLTEDKIDGDILDIGAGGEGLSTLNFPDQVIGIALEEHKEYFYKSPKCKYKILMDVRDMKFLDNSFDNITCYFTLMYINPIDYDKTFEEISRVMKIDGKLYLRDLIFPEKISKERYIRTFQINTKIRQVKTGYGCSLKGRNHSYEYLKKLANKHHLEIIKYQVEDRTHNFVFQKTKKYSI